LFLTFSFIALSTSETLPTPGTKVLLKMTVVATEEAEHLAVVMASRRQPVLMGMRMNCGVSSGSPVLGWLNDTSTDVVNSFLYVEYVDDRMVQRITNFQGLASMDISSLNTLFAAKLAEHKSESERLHVSKALQSLEMIEQAKRQYD
jgi:hypothetical protein